MVGDFQRVERAQKQPSSLLMSELISLVLERPKQEELLPGIVSDL